NVYVPNADETFNQAIAAGAKESMPVADQFWGDRYGSLMDPFGYSWGIATHKEDLSPAEMRERTQQFFASMAQQKTA
ncbi:MAG TPA: VOC family protein, partial [Candidatus Angelobacter sp.]